MLLLLMMMATTFQSAALVVRWTGHGGGILCPCCCDFLAETFMRLGRYFTGYSLLSFTDTNYLDRLRMTGVEWILDLGKCYCRYSKLPKGLIRTKEIMIKLQSGASHRRP